MGRPPRSAEVAGALELDDPSLDERLLVGRGGRWLRRGRHVACTLAPWGWACNDGLGGLSGCAETSETGHAEGTFIGGAGGRGIRTLGDSRHAGFQDQCIRPALPSLRAHLRAYRPLSEPTEELDQLSQSGSGASASSRSCEESSTARTDETAAAWRATPITKRARPTTPSGLKLTRGARAERAGKPGGWATTLITPLIRGTWRLLPHRAIGPRPEQRGQHAHEARHHRHRGRGRWPHLAQAPGGTKPVSPAGLDEGWTELGGAQVPEHEGEGGVAPAAGERDARDSEGDGDRHQHPAVGGGAAGGSPVTWDRSSHQVSPIQTAGSSSMAQPRGAEDSRRAREVLERCSRGARTSSSSVFRPRPARGPEPPRRAGATGSTFDHVPAAAQPSLWDPRHHPVWGSLPRLRRGSSKGG